jgi:hypothetical protein
MKAVTLLLLCIVGAAYADLYMQNPRGCNNRYNEQSDDAQNQNRLFDSENNARGGYAWGPAMTYIAGSLLPIQWTSQHGCGSNQVECNIVIQYMCVDGTDPSTTIRDGLTTTTIVDNANQYNQKSTVNGVTDYTYGMHESYQYYQDCKGRQRNQGLFTADQNLNGNSAQFTRQDAAGTQYGFECNEERDYYPYWGPSPWKDIAVMSPSDDLCKYFQTESQNVKDRGACTGATTTNNAKQPITQAACTTAGGTWNVVPNFGIAAPDCQIAQYTRDNHLGNTLDGETATYNWTIPSNEPCIGTGNCDCALRIRYNVSNAQTVNYPPSTFTDSTQNGKTGAVTTNPVQQVEGDDLQMALNTDQYGRTFQDRSYTFKITGRPANIAASTPIYNLNVRGKRGNIVQTFPATEYDFVPNNLNINEGDYVHFQWTGSDYNPQGNAGEGTAGTDRSNIVQVSSLNSNLPLTQDQINSGNNLFEDASLRHNLAFTGQTNCPTIASLLTKNGNNQNNVNTDPTNCAKLNAAAPHFDAGPVRVNKTGTFYYMSSRNNNFSNRTQKGMIVVTPKPLSAGAIAAIVIFSVLGAAGLAVGGTYLYARKFPHSKIAGVYAKIPKIKNPFSKGSSTQAMSYSVNADNKKPLLA